MTIVAEPPAVTMLDGDGPPVAVRSAGTPSAQPGATPADFIRQLTLLVVAALLYFAVRGATATNADLAVRHARSLIGFERRLHIDIEASLQRLIIDHHAIVTGANWIYIWGHWPVIAITLVWLYRSDTAIYRLLRNAMFLSGAIGLIVFAAYPVAPPRLAGPVFVDTVTELSRSYRVLQPPALVNKYAALPSLHVGWNFLVGVVVWRHATSRPIRLLGAISPVLMIAAVVLTANHYVIDAAAGVAIAAVALWGVGRWPKVR